MQNNLLAINEVISRARKSGVFLGHGDPKVHLAYLTKIRLLPQTVRRKIGDRIVGCYPEYVIPLLSKIEEMKSARLTYSQIKYQLQNQTQDPGKLPFSSSPLPASFLESHYPNPLSGSHSSITFLFIGLILGFLLAVNSNNSALVPNRQISATLPENHNSQPAIRIVEGGNATTDPIYLIAIPNQNLYKLGKTDINLLK